MCAGYTSSVGSCNDYVANSRLSSFLSTHKFYMQRQMTKLVLDARHESDSDYDTASDDDSEYEAKTRWIVRDELDKRNAREPVAPAAKPSEPKDSQSAQRQLGFDREHPLFKSSVIGNQQLDESNLQRLSKDINSGRAA